MTINPFKYHYALVEALVKLTSQQAVDLMEGLFEAGALNLDARNEQGLNLLEAYALKSMVAPCVVEFLDRIGRSDLYTEKGQHSWLVITQQLKRWAPVGGNWQQSDQALAMMINKVEPNWWRSMDRPGDDEGGRLYVQIANMKEKSNHSFASLLKRGINPNARVGNSRTLTASTIREEPQLLAYLQVGGNLENAVEIGGEVPLWRHLAEHAPHISEGFLNQSTPPSTHFVIQKDRLVRQVRNHRKNLVEMHKQLKSLPDWPSTLRFDGTPVWLWALSFRPDILSHLLQVKRRAVDTSARDRQGRSMWFWAHKTSEADADTFAVIQQYLPLDQTVLDHQGHGLITQLFKQDLLRNTDTKSWNNPIKLLELHDGDPQYLLAGIEEINLNRAFLKLNGDNHPNLARMFCSLIRHDETRKRMTPEQRGMCLCAASIFHSSISIFNWEREADDLVHDCETLGIIWPDCSALDAVYQKNKYSAKGEKMSEFVKLWESNYQAQQIGAQTTPTSIQARPARRI